MPKHKEENCVFCGQKEFGIETIDQIPTDICPQDLVLCLLSNSGEKLNPNDFICTAHEQSIRLKYLSFKRNLPFSKQFRREAITLCECCICDKYCNKKYSKIIDISLLSDEFKEFLLNEYAALGKKSTRSGSGIGEGNYLCSGCYQKCRRNKFLKDNEEKCTSTKKKPGPKISVIKDEEESLQSVKCVLCDNIYER